jgi:ABC-type phosphate transport system substrate-binding protein
VRNRKIRLALVAVAAAAAMIMAVAVPAGATIPNTGPTILTGSENSLAQVGSDTSYWMMQGISPQYNVNTTKNLQGDYVTQVPPVNTAPFPAGTYVPADAVTGAFTWTSLSTTGGPCGGGSTPPNGSSAGISCLNADTTGAVDFSRSSRGPKTGETSTLEFWAYAIGAVTWVKFPGSHAPTSLTPTQLIDIYTCSPSTHAPIISDWHTVNPSAPVGSTIKKYAPQTSSGTYSFFNSNVLNGNTIDQNCDSSHLSTFLEEHDARGVTTASFPNAIYAFDYARWTAQSTGFEADLRNGAALGAINGVTPSPSTVNESGTFVDSRYIYNVVRIADHPSTYTQQHNDFLKFAGVRPTSSGGPGFICAGLAAKVIKLAGFVPLASANTGGTGLPFSDCRLNPTPIP